MRTMKPLPRGLTTSGAMAMQIVAVESATYAAKRAAIESTQSGAPQEGSGGTSSILSGPGKALGRKLAAQGRPLTKEATDVKSSPVAAKSDSREGSSDAKPGSGLTAGTLPATKSAKILFPWDTYERNVD